MQYQFISWGRDGHKCTVVYSRDGKIIEKQFPPSMNDAQIKASILEEKIPESNPSPSPSNPVQNQKPEPVPESKPVRKKTISSQQRERRSLKKNYLSFLAAKGIDLSGERSFKKIEAAYRREGGK